MPTASPRDIDVAVIGGGPAGSTVAALLARRGWNVRLLEKGTHPCFHIGESLLPMNLPILERLGVLEAVRAIGVHKPAADFAILGRSHNSFAFERALGDSPPHAFQVRRDEFDQLLFEHARGCGVDCRERSLVRCREPGAGAGSVLEVEDEEGVHQLHARYVVDATGRDTLLSRQFGLKRPNPRHRSAALFSHYQGVARRPGSEQGNISIYRLAHGWCWMIPLPEGLMSVGIVVTPAFLKERRSEPGAFLDEVVRSHPEACARMAGARRVFGPEAAGNYSYTSAAIAGAGWVMAGDAYAFVDPIFSSGVYLAMSGAENAAGLVDAVLREPHRESRLQRAYRRRVDHGIRQFSWFIERFTTPVMQELFEQPRNTWQLEQAVISMLAGDVFDNRAVLSRLRLFRLIYAITGWRQRLRGSSPQAALAGAP